MAPLKMTTSKTKTVVQDHQDYLRSNMLELLAAGWRGYQLEGRGAVVIDDREVNETNRWYEREIKFDYYSNQKAVSSNSGWPTKDIRKLVRDYNPHKQIVCVFLLPNNFCAAYKTWSKDFTPAEAAQQASVEQ